MTIKITKKGKSFDRLEKDLEKAITNELKGILTMAHNEVLAHTPVNTGTLAANTNFSINQPDQSFGVVENEVDRDASQVSLPVYSALGMEKNRPQALSLAVRTRNRALKSFKIDFSKKKTYKFFITNATPYVTDVEYGQGINIKARQSAVGMFRKSVQKIKQNIKSGKGKRFGKFDQRVSGPRTYTE
jgi:hypothetical protein